MALVSWALSLMDIQLSESDELSVVSMNLFVALLCVCIVIDRVLVDYPWINESITALLIGLCSGIILLLATNGRSSRILVFSEDLFFIYLLPPIIFNAGFQVKKKQFFRNFMAIMLFGAFGTMISFIIISFGAMHFFTRMNIGFLELTYYLAIGAIFSATDSICTLKVLDQDETPALYSLVFGEGVVNDATSVVLFNAIHKLDLSTINNSTSSIFLDFAGHFLSLFVLSTLLGVLAGLFSAYIIQKLHLHRHSTDPEIALMFLMAYFSYILAHLFDLSAILTVFFRGIVMSHYAWHNMTDSSRVTTKHAFATLSYVAEVFIFLYVGMDALDIEKWQVISDSPRTSVGVSGTLLVLILIGRAAFVFPLSILYNLMNSSPNQKINLKQQITAWWAGLMRGAVSMALAYNQFAKAGHTELRGNAMVITSTITVVLFSTVVFGMLTKPLVRLLLPASRGSSAAILPSNESLSTTSLTEPLLSGSCWINPVAGCRSWFLSSDLVHYYWRKFDDAYMKPIFGGKGSRVDSDHS